MLKIDYKHNAHFIKFYKNFINQESNLKNFKFFLSNQSSKL